MLRALISMGILAVFYAVFAVLYRNKECNGHCGGCEGACRLTGDLYEDN